ncbi:hypothetical protein [Nevskia sp.]|uniref:hypothetical protein n=1 Tax=Nevskia sp. TaxID=1929292 RepID=UPI003F6F8DDA
MKAFVVSLLLAASLTACSEDKPLAIVIPADVKPEIKQVVEQAWPKVLAACPGFNLYASDLSFSGIEDNLSYAPDHAKRIEMKFRVAENPTRIPVSYRAFGYMCYFGISPDASKLVISKDACASICAGAEVSASSNYEKSL